jgi:hypothetical protein
VVGGAACCAASGACVRLGRGGREPERACAGKTGSKDACVREQCWRRVARRLGAERARPVGVRCQRRAARWVTRHVVHVRGAGGLARGACAREGRGGVAREPEAGRCSGAGEGERRREEGKEKGEKKWKKKKGRKEMGKEKGEEKEKEKEKEMGKRKEKKRKENGKNDACRRDSRR